MLPATDPVESAVLAYEKVTGLRITVHAVDAAIGTILPLERTLHDTACCRAVKADQGLERCMAFDRDRTQRDLKAAPAARIQQCHAGFIECVAPVISGDAVLAVLFAGQRRPGAGLVPMTIDGSAKGQARYDRITRRLPTLDAQQAALALELLQQLAARLAQWHERAARSGRSTATEHGAPRDRLSLIRRHIRDLHAGPARVEDLAAVLHLSPSRAAHVVVELTGKSWIQLITEARISSAAAMLRHTDLPVADVGRRAGFRHASHFHRTFLKHTGQTPAEYRRAGV